MAINMIKCTPNLEKGYCLRLANGQRWHIIPTEGVRRWVERLARIVQLQTCEPNGCPKLIFIHSESRREWCGGSIGSEMPDIFKGFPRGGWKSHDLRALILWSSPEVPDVICEMRPGGDHALEIIRMWLSLYPIYKRAQDSGGLPFHAALVERDGIGILLAAPGDTGKSTCCRRLPGQWHALCDDEALIVRDGQKQYLAHPFPTWSDYLWRRSERTWNVQRYIPVSAIFFLEQAKVDQAVPMGQGEAAAFTYQSAIQVCSRNWRNLDHKEERGLKESLFKNGCELAKAVPAFKLRVSPNGQFWNEMEKVL